MNVTFTFTSEQHTTLLAALALAAQRYADPAPVISVLSVVSRPAAIGVQRGILEREIKELELRRINELEFRRTSRLRYGGVELALIAAINDARARLALLNDEPVGVGS